MIVSGSGRSSPSHSGQGVTSCKISLRLRESRPLAVEEGVPQQRHSGTLALSLIAGPAQCPVVRPVSGLREAAAGLSPANMSTVPAMGLDADGALVPEVAYYYPEPFWGGGQADWIKSLLLFFDQVAILLPEYRYGRHAAADPALAGALEEMGLLIVLRPETFVDQAVTEDLAGALVELLAAGVFDDLPPAGYFVELSRSRMGWSADVELSDALVE